MHTEIVTVVAKKQIKVIGWGHREENGVPVFLSMEIIKESGHELIKKENRNR